MNDGFSSVNTFMMHEMIQVQKNGKKYIPKRRILTGIPLL